MKKLLLALFLVFTLPLSAEEQPAVPTADEQAAALINAQEWFRLEACYPEIRDELSPFVRLLCEASLGSHFNRLPESCNAIGTLLNDYQQELFADPEGSMLGWLLSMLIGNLQELGAYEQAADLLTQFAAGQSEEERASTLATQRWFQTMARHPRTSLTKPDGEIRLPLTVGSETVKSPLDGTDKKVHNFYTDITIGGRTERFIFDTGCSGASFVSAEFAKRHDLEIICDSISVSGIGGNGFVKRSDRSRSATPTSWSSTTTRLRTKSAISKPSSAPTSCVWPARSSFAPKRVSFSCPPLRNRHLQAGET